MRKLWIVSLIITASFAVISVSFAADKVAAQKEKAVSPSAKKGELKAPSVAAPQKAKAKEMTASEMSTEIMDSLDQDEEILNFIPGLKKETDKAGKVSYTFEGVKIEKLDKDKIKKLYSRVSQEKLRIRTDRLNRQMETVKRSQQIASTSGGAPRGVQTINTVPRVPQAPTAGARVPQTPRAPSPPASPKR